MPIWLLIACGLLLVVNLIPLAITAWAEWADRRHARAAARARQRLGLK